MNKKLIYLVLLLVAMAATCPIQAAQSEHTAGASAATIEKNDSTRSGRGTVQAHKGKKKTAVASRRKTAEKTVETIPASTLQPATATPLTVTEIRVARTMAPTDSNLLAWVNFLVPAPERQRTSTLQASIPLDYSRGQKAKYDEKNNTEAMYKLQAALRTLKADPNITVTGIHLTGFTAPDTDFRLNEKNGMQRALALTDHIRTHRSLDAIPYEVNWVAEDWTMLTRLIEQSEMPFKAAVLDIIRTVEVADGREKTLMNLAGGNPYRYIQSYFFPQLRRIAYVIDYQTKAVPAFEPSGKQQNYADMSLNDFYNLSQAHARGSDEFNDLTDLAGRLFPNNPVACINAAAVALSKRDTQRARGYLIRFSTLAEAGNNMGILFLLEGNLDKAEVYLELAKAAGAKQAEGALEYIRKTR